MKIKSFKKMKNNCYRVEFGASCESIILYDEVILKYNLLVKKEFDSNFLKKLILENNSLECYYKGINYISYKRRSKREVEDYLKKSGFLKEEISLSIKRLEEEGFIDEKGYLEAFINDQIRFNNHGPLKIIQKLKLLGFQEKEIRAYLDTFSTSIWRDKIVSIVDKKIKSNRHLGGLKLKEKLMFFLVSEGFNKEEVKAVLDEKILSSNETILKKELEKYSIKLSRKYAGSTLKYQLRLKLLTRGFESEAINEALDEFYS